MRVKEELSLQKKRISNIDNSSSNRELPDFELEINSKKL